MRLAPLILLALVGCRPVDPGAPISEGPDPEPVAMAASAGAADNAGWVRIIDGDTFVMDGQTVRIANIDTAEMPPRSLCLAEAQLARAAKAELGKVLELEWGISLRLEPRGEDQYGRTLALVKLSDGTDVGDEMVRRGFAQIWRGRREDWCATGVEQAADRPRFPGVPVEPRAE